MDEPHKSVILEFIGSAKEVYNRPHRFWIQAKNVKSESPGSVPTFLNETPKMIEIKVAEVQLEVKTHLLE